MDKSIKILFSCMLIMMLSLTLASAMSISSVTSENFQPGSEQTIGIKIKNTLSADATSVSISLDTSNFPFAVLDTEDSNDIDEDESEIFSIKLKASNDATAKDYQIPYIISYYVNGTQMPTKNGTIALTVEANPDLTFSALTENPIIGMQGKIKITIVNKGFGDAKFFTIKIIPSGYSLVSEDNEYIGTISSDDTETATFDVLFTSTNPIVNAEIEYRDFSNEKITKKISLPITAYSQEQALKMGLIKPNNTLFYVIGIVAVIVGWTIFKKIRKKKRMNKSQGK